MLKRYGEPVHGSHLQLLVLIGLVASGVPWVSGITAYTSSELEAVNGTSTRLKCTFQTSEPVSSSSVTVSWTFRPQDQGQEESVLYYREKAYPVDSGRFHKQVEWAGDIMRKDASITLRDVKFSYNGTFTCRVTNPPDVHGRAGELRLRVVTSASVSEIAILAAAIGGGILLMLIILIAVVAIKHYQRKHEDIEDHCASEKGSTMCQPEEDTHLHVMEEKAHFERPESRASPPSMKDEGEKLCDNSVVVLE
ncbi:myelin protein zero-like protein 2b [Brienomyrus brachyistius]|uniref:myelin protein zero-like protein 2b n=1 Tax=Brienomyrus brachyistius TaxID=42636 RepID=UPI0020B283D8|nr:myelin protein zero-like protein 2b [Brienomyrus brachyistius]